MRTREQILKECVNAAVACFQHYCDQQVSEDSKKKVEAAISNWFPEEITQERHNEYVKQYEEKYAEIEFDN